ncbi:MAG: M50 family metallopeptidase [Bacteroidales bacterium]|nr:M50 family metallopeptidase [Bacteroidales bacterium]
MTTEQTYMIFYLTLAFAAFLPRIPYIGRYFQVFNTMVHEDGHALMALISRGKAQKIELFADTSGSTITYAKSKLSHFLTSLAGYPASAGAAYLLFYLLNQQDELTLLIAISVLLALNLILFVRNTYGVIWILTLGGLLYLLFYFDNLLAMRIAVTFFAGVLFWGSLFAPLTLIKIAWQNPRQAGDAANLNKLTGIPSLLWSLLFLAFSLWIAYFTIRQFPLAEGVIDQLKDINL